MRFLVDHGTDNFQDCIDLNEVEYFSSYWAEDEDIEVWRITITTKNSHTYTMEMMPVQYKAFLQSMDMTEEAESISCEED